MLQMAYSKYVKFVIKIYKMLNKSMKKLSLSFFVFALVIGSISCKKEVPPSLIVTVVDNDNVPQEGKWVKTSVPGAIFGIVNGEVIDSAETDVFGKVFFDYENTIIIDLSLFDKPNDNVIIDSASVLLETKRKKGDENRTEVKLTFRE